MGFLDEFAKLELDEEIRNKLTGEYNGEISAATAKIDTLKAANDEAARVLAEKDNELRDVKSRNWDLSLQTPVMHTTPPADQNDGGVTRSGKALLDKYKTKEK